jgi:hypothetical protein
MNNTLRTFIFLCAFSTGWAGNARAVQSTEDAFVPYARAAAFRAGLPDLEEMQISRGDIGLRLWDGFGLTGIRGLVLQRTRGVWRASLVEPKVSGGGYRVRQLPDTVAWAERWAEAIRAGLLNVEPVASRADGLVARDGYAVVVELYEGGRYRTAGSEAVDAPCGTDTRRLLEIAEILLGEDRGCRR